MTSLLGNIQENFYNETLFYYFTDKPPTILFLEIYKSFQTISKMVLLQNCLRKLHMQLI